MPHTTTDIPTTEPKKITAGSTVKWRKSLSHFSASDGWVLTYALRGPAIINITSTANGLDHDVTLALAITAAYTKGIYWWNSYATKAGERFNVDSGQIEILPDLAAIASGTYDGRTHARKVLDAIEAFLEDKATTADLEVEIQGRKVKSWLVDDLLKFRGQYRAEVQAEISADLAERGEATPTKIYTSFV